jgi:hypothetical protein
MGLMLYSEAKEAYERAAKIEPDNQGLHAALQKAEMLELQQAGEKKHVFKKHRVGSGRGEEGAGRDRKVQKCHQSEGKKSLLSFDDAGEEE